LVTLLMILVKILPLVPGHFTRYEWLALAIWATLGYLARIRGKQVGNPSEQNVRIAQI
jgi:hypothetical protein